MTQWISSLRLKLYLCRKTQGIFRFRQFRRGFKRTDAKNVKIIVRDGKSGFQRPVVRRLEKVTVAASATDIAGKDIAEDELEINVRKSGDCGPPTNLRSN
jgi:hypothetical protein